MNNESRPLSELEPPTSVGLYGGSWTEDESRREDLRLMFAENRLKLNLGSGPKRFHKKDHINIDISPACDPDFKLDVENRPMPFETNSVISAYADNLLEHLGDLTHFMNELHRVLRVGGLFWFRVPAVDRFELLEDDEHNAKGFKKAMQVIMWGAFRDPTHKTFFCQGTMDYWNHEHPTHRDYGRAYSFLPWHVETKVFHNPSNGLFFYDVTQVPIK